MMADERTAVGGDRDFARRLVRERRVAGLSQRQLQNLSGIPRSRISRYETAITTPTATTVRSLCKALGITADRLIIVGK